MLDIKFIRENKALVQKAAEDKRFKVDLDKLLELDDKLKVQKNDLEVLQAERNTLSKKIGKASSNEEREQLKAKVSEFKPKMAELETVVKDLEAAVHEELLRVPNPAREDVPVGKDDADNVQVKTWGEVPEFDFKLKDHVELGKLHDIIDIERGVKLAAQDHTS